MVRRILWIALWEWRQQLRQWSFLLSMGLPLLLAVAVGWGARGREGVRDTPVVVAVWDETGRWLRQLVVHWAQRPGEVVLYPLQRAEVQDTPWERVAAGEWAGIIWLRADSVGVQAELWARQEMLLFLRQLILVVEEGLRERYVQQLGLPEPVRAMLLHPLRIREHPVVASGALRWVRSLVAVVALLVLSSSLVWAARTLTEERFWRVSEFLLSFLTGHELVVGKFLSVLGIGVVQSTVVALLWGLWGGGSGAAWRAGVSLVCGCAVMAAVGVWLGLRARNEAQLHGRVTMALVGLSLGLVALVWGGPALVPVLTAVPAWMPLVVFWVPEPSYGGLLGGAFLSVGMVVALLRDAGAGVGRLLEVLG